MDDEEYLLPMDRLMALVLSALVGVALMAYTARGYWRGQADLLRQGQTDEAEGSVLRRWRRVAGWAAYVFSVLLFCLFLFLAYRYAQGGRWSFWMAAWVLWFATFLGGIWLAEWCLKPDRETQHPRADDPDSTDDTPAISFRVGRL